MVIVVTKEGVPYADYKSRIQPLDLVLFKGGDFVSDLIRDLEADREHGHSRGDFSHSGIIVTTEVVTHPAMKPGRLYIMESTATGLLGCGIKNIDGQAFFGVQITDFDKLVEAYDGGSSRTRMAVATLKSRDAVKGKTLQAFWEQYRGTLYEFNILSMLCAIFPKLRFARKQFQKILGGGNWIFCSQLVCMALKAVNVYDQSINAEDVVPEDFVVIADNDGLPLVFTEPVYILSSKYSDGGGGGSSSCGGI